MKENNTIIFENGFSPDRIGGNSKQLKELGIKLIGRGGEFSIMWDYEYPIIKIRKNKKFNVRIDWNDEHDFCDIIFENGVIFGYVDECDFKVVK